MRDDNFKLVHAPIDEHLTIHRFEVAIDIDIKYNPLDYNAIVDIPLPVLPKAKAPNIQLFDMLEDNIESNDINKDNREIALRMDAELTNWFIEVECERNNITAK